MRHLYIIVLLVCSTLVANAQQQLTLEQCREMAIDNNFNLKSSNEKIAASGEILAAYKTNRLPNLSASGNYIYTTASFSETISGGYLPTFTPDLTTGEMIPNIVGTAADGSYIFGEYAYMPDMNFDIDFNSI